MKRSSQSSPTHRPALMRTIYFSNRERIMIGDDNIQYMNYLSKKLPPADYTDDESSNRNETRISIGDDANTTKK